MSTYSQASNKSNCANPSISAKSQHSPLDKRNDQRNTGSAGTGSKSNIIKPTQPNQTGAKTNQNNTGNQAKNSYNQWKASASENCSSSNRNA